MSQARVYVGTFRIGDLIVGVDVIYRFSGLMGMSVEAHFSWSPPDQPPYADANRLPYFTDDVREAARLAVLGALAQARFLGHVGAVDLVHVGAFDEDDLRPLLAVENAHHQLVCLQVGESGLAARH